MLARSLAAQIIESRIDSLFVSYDRIDSPGCVVGVRQNGEDLHVKAYGMANLEYGVPLTTGSISETGSVAKQFTAAAVGLLALRGKLSLDDDIRRYLPEVPDFGRPITIRHLLHHTSGLRDQWGLLAVTGNPPGRQVHDFPLILDLVSRQRMLNFPPGEEYLYSNTGYALTAILVSRVAGTSFAEFTRDELFRPLGMTDTRWRDDFRTVVPGRASAYEMERGAWVQDMPFTNVHGNGGLLTTVGDLLRWNDALSEGTIPGGPELVRMLETPGRLNDGSEIRYALGLGINRYHELREVSHGGSTAGYRTQLVRWPEKGLSVAILCNAANAVPGREARRIADLVLALDDVAPTPPSSPVPIAVDRLQPLVGLYRDSTTDQVISIGLRVDTLVVGVVGGGQGARLTHLGELRFWSPVAGDYRFERNGSAWRIVRFAEAWRRYEPFTRVDPAGVTLSDYVGRYHSDELGIDVVVEEREGSLWIRAPHSPPLRLMPTYPDGFTSQGRSFRFTRDGSDAVSGLRMFAGRVRDLRFSK